MAEFGLRWETLVGGKWREKELIGGSWASHNDNLKFLQMSERLLRTVRNIKSRDVRDWDAFSPVAYDVDAFH